MAQTGGYFGDVKGKVALITGASSGIGAATAVEFAKQGIRLSLHGRNVERLTSVQQKCVQEGLTKDDVFVVTGDIMSSEDMKEVVAKTLDKFGTVNMLINNAGIGQIARIPDVTSEDMDKMFRMHVKAPLQMVQLLLEHLVKNKGTVVNVSSIGAMIGVEGNCSYGIAKAGMKQLTTALNAELGPQGVRVNTILPGATSTGFAESAGFAENKEQGDKFVDIVGKSCTVLGRGAVSEEIARAILFLATDASSYMVGQHMVVDGGVVEMRAINAPRSIESVTESLKQ